MAPEPQKMGKISQMEALGFVWEVFASIAIPTTLFALAGRALDARWNTSPYVTLAGLALSLALAGVLVLRKAKTMAIRLKSDGNKV